MRVLGGVLLVLATCALGADVGGVPDSRYARFARGVNLNNIFQYGNNFQIGQQDVDLLKANGFTCVRLPVAPDYIVGATESALEKLDSTIDLLLNGGIAVTLDFHADGTYVDYLLKNASPANQLASVWRTLARRYANRDPELLSFEIMNEPTNAWTQQTWDAIQKPALAAIREEAPNHTVLLAPVNWSGIDGLLGMTPYPDQNVIYVLHDYNPFTFTHQHASWTGDATLMNMQGIAYPSWTADVQALIDRTTDSRQRSYLLQYQSDDWDRDRMDWDLSLAEAWSKMWGVRVVVNEFGAYKTYSPPDSRARWTRDMVSVMTAHGFGFSMWDYQSGFDLVVGALGNRAIDPLLAPAFGLQPWTAPDPPRAKPAPVLGGVRNNVLGAISAPGSGSEGLFASDLNADGRPDLIATPINWPSLAEFPVEIVLNQGAGVMTPAVWEGPATLQRFADSIAVGRFDSSGRAGLFLADQASNSRAKLVLPGSAANAWRDATPNLPAATGSAIGAAAADVDGDGFDDVVVFENGPGRPAATLLRNDGAGVFREDPNALPPAARSGYMCGAFLRRPNEPVSDLVALEWSGTTGRVFRNDGRGTFSLGPILPPAGLSPVTGGCMATADLNNDGYLDLVIGYHSYNPSANGLQILIQNRDGTFHDETDLRIGRIPWSGDLRRVSIGGTADGKSRALVLTIIGRTPMVFVDNGSGVFVSTSAQPGSDWVSAAVDLNGDNRLDIAYSSWGGDGPVFRAQFARAPLPADGPLPPAVQHPFFFGATDAAAYTSTVSPGQWMAIFGQNILPSASGTRSWTGDEIGGSTLPTALDGVKATVGGKPAAVSFISPGQINVQVPDIATGDYARVDLTTPNGTSSGSVMVQPQSPALFVVGGSASDGWLPAARTADGKTILADAAAVPGTRAAHPGEDVALYGTGFGPTNPARPAGQLVAPAEVVASVRAQLGGRDVTASRGYLVAPGLNQLNIKVPADMAPGRYDLRVWVGEMPVQSGLKLVVQY